MVRKRHAGGMGMAGRKKTFVAKEAAVDVSEAISDLYLSSAKVNFYVSEPKTIFYVSI